MNVAVAGGTGTVGRVVVAALTAAGHDTTVMARSTGVDLTTGQGLREALRPAAVVIDVANVVATSRRTSVRFFEQATANLLAAERELGINHHVVLSIVGIDEVDFGYYIGKRRQEELVKAGDRGWTILRSTQFHDYPAQLAARIPGPLLPVPRMTVQPVATTDVAQLMLEIASSDPRRTTLEVAGPEVRQLTDMSRRWLRASSSRRVVMPVRLPGRAGSAMAGDGLLPTGDFRRGQVTFDSWLANQAPKAPSG